MSNIITIASYSLKRSVSIILGWGIPLMLLGIITIPFYDLVAENEKQLRPVLDTLKPLLKSFIGGDEAEQVFTPEGFIALRYFAFLPVVMGIFGSVYGSGLLAADEDRGILTEDLLRQMSNDTSYSWGNLGNLSPNSSLLRCGYMLRINSLTLSFFFLLFGGFI